MTVILFAGGDIRVSPELPDPSWDADRRERYLLRPEIVRPLSVDQCVWPRPEHREGLGGPLPWVDVEAVRLRWMSTPGGSASGWVVIAIGVVVDDAEAREHLAVRRGIGTVLEVGPAWRFLGYDVADEGNISGLSNCGFDGGDVGSLRAKWASRINEHGLLADPSDATSFRSMTDRRVPEHAPFEVYGIWQVP